METDNSKNGIIRMFLPLLEEKKYSEGRFEGKAEGKLEGSEQKSYEVVSNLISEFDFSDEHTARASGTTVDFVRKVRSAALLFISCSKEQDGNFCKVVTDLRGLYKPVEVRSEQPVDINGDQIF